MVVSNSSRPQRTVRASKSEWRREDLRLVLISLLLSQRTVRAEDTSGADARAKIEHGHVSLDPSLR